MQSESLKVENLTACDWVQILNSHQARLPEGRGRSEIEVAVRVCVWEGHTVPEGCPLHFASGEVPAVRLELTARGWTDGELAVVLCKMSFCFGLVTLDGIILLTLTLSPEDQRQTNNSPKTTYSAPHVPARQPKREPPRGASSITLMMLC